MALVTMKELLLWAENKRCAVGAFSVGNMEMVMGAVRAAEETKTPIILQIAEKRLPYSPLSLMGPMMVAAAKAADTDAKDEKKGEKSQETKASDSGKTQGSEKNAKPQSKPAANTSKNAQASPAAS